MLESIDKKTQTGDHLPWAWAAPPLKPLEDQDWIAPERDPRDRIRRSLTKPRDSDNESVWKVVIAERMLVLERWHSGLGLKNTLYTTNEQGDTTAIQLFDGGDCYSGHSDDPEKDEEIRNRRRYLLFGALYGHECLREYSTHMTSELFVLLLDQPSLRGKSKTIILCAVLPKTRK
eukprot:TRINITY_DN40470_c0_g1_i7.p1 TRINITY_DN40470_c0_g1~~TRINITY_DN40470_c0_g1_i7.p1  ORF type:complete len:175 (-),score=4.66 TRINITY_DN40470_c0_g1_i7:402-926(-)